VFYSDLVRVPAVEETSWSCIPPSFHNFSKCHTMYYVPVPRSLRSENLAANCHTAGFVNEEGKSDIHKSWGGRKDLFLCVTSIEPNMCERLRLNAQLHRASFDPRNCPFEPVLRFQSWKTAMVAVMDENTVKHANKAWSPTQSLSSSASCCKKICIPIPFQFRF
jgi:hypothetical protein